MKTMIAYSNRSCVTGKELREALSGTRKRTDRRAKCDLFIRWGSTEVFDNVRYKKELNSLEAVLRTTNKLQMLQTLQAAGIPVINFGNDVARLSEFVDREGGVYVRNRQGVVRYDTTFNPATDLYFSQPVRFKRREYRVHVFNGQVLGAYEKVPLSLAEGQARNAETLPKLFKSDTCRFIRCDLVVDENGLNPRVNAAAQQMCVDAVRALGLTFGGVDLIRNKHGEFTMCEVNSAPGLNGLNVDRWVQAIREYYAQE
jgi:hypothetical protein